MWPVPIKSAIKYAFSCLQAERLLRLRKNTANGKLRFLLQRMCRGFRMEDTVLEMVVAVPLESVSACRNTDIYIPLPPLFPSSLTRLLVWCGTVRTRPGCVVLWPVTSPRSRRTSPTLWLRTPPGHCKRSPMLVRISQRIRDICCILSIEATLRCCTAWAVCGVCVLSVLEGDMGIYVVTIGFPLCVLCISNDLTDQCQSYSPIVPWHGVADRT